MNKKLSKKENGELNNESNRSELKKTTSQNNLKEQSKTSSPKKRKKRPGRKKIKRSFDETRIAHFLKHEAPLEYQLIMGATVASPAPSADFIEAIGYASSNPLFKKPKFRRSLMKYRKEGLYSGRAVKSNANIELYYIRLRKSQ